MKSFFKILFSNKYDENFGGKIIGSFNKRHQIIIEVFCISSAFIIITILFIQYLINNYY